MFAVQLNVTNLQSKKIDVSAHKATDLLAIHFARVKRQILLTRGSTPAVLSSLGTGGM
jgi:hypothetical protein